jgi:cell wall-associated NlpC family hydrolase
MKYFGLLFWLLIGATTTVFAQEKFISHKISQGETISTIAEKYHVSQKVIFDLNPNASGILKLNSVLKIPNKNFKKEVAQKELTKKELTKKELAKKELVAKTQGTKEIEYEVLPKETLFGIAKKYNLSVDEIKKSNPSIDKLGLQIGKKIKLIVSENFQLKEEKVVVVENESLKKTEIAETTTPINEFLTTTSNEGQQTHQVVASETKYGIAKRYGITIAELEKWNPNIVAKGLEVGQQLNVPLQNKTVEMANTVVVSSATEIKTDVNAALVKEEIVKETVDPIATTSSLQTAIVHEVLPKETKFGIAKKYGITIAELEQLNPSLHKKLRVGSVLKIKEGNPVVDVEDTVVANESSESKKTTFDDAHANHTFFGNYTVADNLIANASDNLGIRYRSGGTTKAGFDCSGFVCYAFNAMDIKLPRSSGEMANVGLKINAQEAQKGDLIFFKTRGSRRINHVGVVVEVQGDEIKFIHSSTSSGVVISSTKEGYYHKNFVQVNRVLK